MDSVALVKFHRTFFKSLQNALQLIGGLNLTDETILIKPNICVETDPSGGANVNSKTIQAVIDIVLSEKKNSMIKIIEADSVDKDIDKAFENMGFSQLVEKYPKRVSLVNLSKEPTTTISFDGLHFKSLELPKILLAPNYFISVANAKTHGITGITGILKNQFGCLPQKNKARYHKHINEVIVDLNRIFKPNLSIVDAAFGMEGVVKGKLRKLGVLICGYAPLSVDATLSRIMDFNPSKIKHLTLAQNYELGSFQPKVVGEKIENIKIKFHKPNSLVKELSEHVPQSLRPFAKGMYYRFLARKPE
ncbi:MAG: DUF362 domain-containing protein [Candidatus Bathyarchaeota archaeon]